MKPALAASILKAVMDAATMKATTTTVLAAPTLTSVPLNSMLVTPTLHVLTSSAHTTAHET